MPIVESNDLELLQVGFLLQTTSAVFAKFIAKPGSKTSLHFDFPIDPFLCGIVSLLPNFEDPSDTAASTFSKQGIKNF
ncbi:hypothetical protein R1flu_027540 [Riccia fluitans]|uniref:Uncharacterized protein n=1 Tax=Riccia fluitans TaxID=41844 RepID=A0ABD1XJ50_9MARC